MDKTHTKVKILDAAELLFAQGGFADTSLRHITAKAGVNLASVNYHFGSKKALIQAVLERYLRVFMPELDRRFLKFNRIADVNLMSVLSEFVEPLTALNTLKPGGTAIFLKLLGRGYSDHQGHLRWYFKNQYGEVLDRFVALVARCQPELSRSDLFWRLHFALGTVVFTLASSDALKDIAQADYQELVDSEGLVRRLLPYIASGLAAPVPQIITLHSVEGN